jgi:DNA-binding NtrC family response regulator
MRNESYARHLNRIEPAAIVGISPWARNIRAEILTVSACPSNVLITGPTGTGKEVIARAIHAHSPRADMPFIPVDCAAIPGALFSSHIFGHAKGAFTGADNDALGCFRAAQRGTVFLDEIGELECEIQTKLLRVLQQRTVIPVGSHREIPVDVRVIAATNRDLEREVREGRFREDLYYRLNVIALRTTPLRDRPEDIPELARGFLNKLAITQGLPVRRLSEAALSRLRQYSWPGNVRQLENMLERAAYLCRDELIDGENVLSEEKEPRLHAASASSSHALPILRAESQLANNCPAANPRDCCLAVAEGRWSTMADVERIHIRRTLELTLGNQSEAAQMLNMERHQLARKVRKYGLEVPLFKRIRASKRAT